MINYILLVSRQGTLARYLRCLPSFNWPFRIGKVRLAKWFTTMSPKAKSKIVKDVTQLVLARRTRMCNFLEYKGMSSTVSILFKTESVKHLTCCKHRYQGGVQTLCITLLCLRRWFRWQRTGDPWSYTSICRGAGPILWQCKCLYWIFCKRNADLSR